MAQKKKKKIKEWEKETALDYYNRTHNISKEEQKKLSKLNADIIAGRTINPASEQKYKQLNDIQKRKVGEATKAFFNEKYSLTNDNGLKYKDISKNLFQTGYKRFSLYDGDNRKTYLQKQKELQTGKKITEIKQKDLEEINKKAEKLKSKKKLDKEINTQYLTQYLEDEEKVNSEEITFLDKINVLRPMIVGLENALSPREYTNENGVKVDLPSYSELKEDKTYQELGFLGKAVHGSAQSIGQMLPSIAVGLIPGIGKIGALATTFATSYNSAKNQKLLEGYSEEKANSYAILNAGLEAGLGRLIGGATKMMGGTSSPLAKNLSNISEKVIKNKGVSRILGHLGAEEAEELTQMVLDPINEYVTLGEYENLGEALSTLNGEEAGLTALSTLITIGLTEGKTSYNLSKLQKNVEQINKQYGTDFKLKQNAQIINNQIGETITQQEINDQIVKQSKIKQLQEQELINIEQSKQELENNFQNGIITEEQYEQEINNLSNRLKTFTQEIHTNKVNPITEIEVEKQLLDEQFNNNLITEEEYNNSLSSLDESLKELSNNNQTLTNQNKIDAFRETANEYWDNSKESQEVKNLIEKVIKDKDYNIILDPNIGNNVGGLATTNQNGEVEIRLNPNSNRAVEFLLVHEVTHAIENSSMKKFVMNFARKNPNFVRENPTFKNALKSLEQTYNSEDVSSEVLADISGQLLGNQEFINSLAMQNTAESKSIIKTIYEEIKRLLNTLTKEGRYRNFVQDLETKWREAYRTTTTEEAVNNLNNGTIFSIQTDINGNKYVNVDTDQDIFEGKSLSEQNKIARKYILDHFRENGLIYNDENINVNSKTAIKYTNPKEKITRYNKKVKNRISTELDNLLSVSTKNSESSDKKNHSFAKDGWEYYQTLFKIDGNYFTGILNIGKNSNQKTLYDINNIKKTTQNGKLDNSSVILNKSSFSTNTIPQSNKNVKSNNVSTKYSIQENTNNTQELNNSSFSYDNQGRELSPQQQEYFKDSKARDENGKLLEVYHGTEFDFTKFDQSKLGLNSGTNMKGIWLTTDENYASTFAGKNLLKGYVNITNPFNQDKVTMKLEDLKKAVAEFSKDYDVPAINKQQVIEKLYNKENTSDVILYNDITRAIPFNKLAYFNNYIKEYTGKDGVLFQINNGKYYAVAFESNQFKNVDNLNPTTNEDIRYSSNNQTWQKFLDDNYKATGKRTNMADIRRKPNSNTNTNTESQTSQNKNLLPINKEVKKAVEPIKKDITDISKQIAEIRKALGIKNPTEISKLTKEDANTTPKLPNKKASTGSGDSSFFENVTKKTKMLSEKSRDIIKTEDDVAYYEKVTNEESLSKAMERLDTGGKNETLSWFNKDSRNADSTDVAEGWILLKQYQDAQDYDSMVEVAKKMREIGTKAGQTVQAFNIMERLTPEGMVKYAQSELSEAYDKMIKNKTNEWIEQHRSDFDLKPAEVEFIMKNMEDVSKMEDGYDKRVKLAEIQKLVTDKLPPERGAGIKAWMRISMLFNPKTQVRNIVGNALISPVNVVGDTFASMIDRQIAKKTGIRTTGVTNLKNYAKGMKEGLYQSYNDFKKGINTRNIQGNRFEIGEGKSFNDKKAMGKALNRVDSMLSFMLDAGDRTFYEASFTNSINNQLVLNKTDTVTQDMIDIATEEALSRTWQDNNKFTQFVLRTRKGLNNLAGNENFGLGDVLIPFAKTPANLTKALIDYSPAGMISTITKGVKLNRSLKNGQYNPQIQHQFVQSLGKATAGTMLYVLGYSLAKAGITSGDGDDDKDVANFLKNTLGINNYSIKIGDKSFTYDWAQPVAGAFSIMANMVNSEEKEKALLEAIVGNLDTAGAILLEQSFMQSINDVLNNNDGMVSGLVTEILELPSRALPTFSKQIADMIDGTQRTSFEKGSPIKTSINQVKAKLPFVSKTLAPSVDSLGREIQKYGGKNNVFNVFFNPANLNSENVNEAGKELYRLYKETGDKTVMPRVVPYTVEINGEKKDLSSVERAKYQKESGKIVEEEMNRLLKSSKYTKLSNEEKVEVTSDIINYAYNKIQEKMFGKEIASEYKNADKFVSKGGTIADYYRINNNLKWIENEYEYKKDLLNENSSNYASNSEKLSSTKRKNIINSIINENINKEAKAFIYNKYYGSETTTQSIVNSGINFNEYLKFVRTDYKSDKDSEGNTIKDSRKKKVFNAINKLNLNKVEKAMLVRLEYTSFDDYNYQIFKHIDDLNLSKKQKEAMFETFGFEVKGGRVYW